MENDQLMYEELMGIKVYRNDIKGFQGIFKHRFSDFIVRECDVNNSVAILDSINGQELEEKSFPSLYNNNSNIDEKDNKANTNIYSISDFIEKIKELNYNDENEIKSLTNYLNSCVEKKKEMEQYYIGMKCDEKEERKTLHMLAKQYLKSLIETQTATVDGHSHISFYANHIKKSSTNNNNGNNNNNKKIKRAVEWPSNIGKYLKFLLIKENIDTMQATTQICKNLHVKEGAIGFAGTKDKRGITMQWCTAFKKKPSHFNHMNKNKSYKGALFRVGNFSYVDEPLRLGDLSGNQFTIILREVSVNNNNNNDNNNFDSIIDIACNALKMNGFLNYYGMQRFGRGGASNSKELGCAYLKNDYTKAIELLCGIGGHPLGPRMLWMDELSSAYQSNNIQKAIEVLPTFSRIERSVLQSLAKAPNDYTKAIHTIPRNTRLLCQHAYQSYIFNHVLTARIEKYGYEVVIGDLIILSNESKIEYTANEAEIHVVTKQDVEDKKFNLEQVVLPLCGSSIQLPQNDIASIYREILASDDLTMEKIPLSGVYRPIVLIPTDMNWNIISYSNNDDEIESTELTPFKKELELEKNNTITEDNISSKQNLKAVRLQFKLNAGCYATMATREIVRSSLHFVGSPSYASDFISSCNPTNANRLDSTAEPPSKRPKSDK